MAVQNLDNRDRFLVVADIFPYAEDEALANQGSSSIAYKRYIKCNLETIYGGNAGTVADINSGGLFMLTCANNGTIAGESGIVRVRFVDE